MICNISDFCIFVKKQQPKAKLFRCSFPIYRNRNIDVLQRKSDYTCDKYT